MKVKILVLLLSALILSSCREEKMEVLNDVYLSKPDTPAKLNDKEVKQAFRNVNTDNQEAGKILEAEVFVNEKGNIDKINIKQKLNGKIKDQVISAMRELKFEPAVLNGQKVKSQTVIYVGLKGSGKKTEWKAALNDDFNTGVNTLPASLKEEDFHVTADQMPEPIGGIMAIASKIRYPEIAKRAGIEGKVLVSAYIDEKGNVIHTAIIKGIGQNCGIDEAAMEAINQVKFKPAVSANVPVKSKVIIPVMFKLQ